jgi:hypothetical protein
VPAFLLGAIERLVRGLEEISRRGSVRWMNRDAERSSRSRQRLPEMREIGIPDCEPHLLGTLARAFKVRFRKHDRKFFTTVGCSMVWLTAGLSGNCDLARHFRTA